MLLTNVEEDTFATEGEVRDILGWAKEEVTELWSVNNIMGEMEYDDDIVNTIDEEDLLKVSSPETLQETSVDRRGLIGSSPTVQPTVARLFTSQDPMMSWTGPRHSQVFLKPRTGFREEIIQTESTSPQKDSSSPPPDEGGLRRRKGDCPTENASQPAVSTTSSLEHLPMVFTVLFMLILCLVQMISDMAGIALTPLTLLSTSTFLSVCGVMGKFVRSSLTQ